MLLALLAVTVAACTNEGRTVGPTSRNDSSRSIPLEIPGVMNPNLNAKSNSGVELEGGQEVFFTNRGRKTLLLRICNEKAGDTILVNELIARRTAELDAERQR